MKRNEVKLPLFYQQETSAKNQVVEVSDDDDDEENKVLQEYIKMCLLDPTFGGFVKKVEKEIVSLISSETGFE